MTLSPWEQDFPWPHWIRRAHALQNLRPSELAAAEALAVAHALRQTVGGFLAGSTNGRWSAHMFGDKSGGPSPVKAFFSRFEYQDGGGHHVYGKGRGSLHVHCLFWFTDVRAVHLESLLCAHLPHEDEDLVRVAKRVQTSEASDPAAVWEYPSAWSWDQRCGWFLRLRTSQEFEDLRLRPFLRCLLRIFRCH